MILTHVKDEQDAFWCLVFIMVEHNWREIFNVETPKLIELLEDVDINLKKKFPKLCKHIQKEASFDMTAIFSSIFITLFVYDVPH